MNKIEKLREDLKNEPESCDKLIGDFVDNQITLDENDNIKNNGLNDEEIKQFQELLNEYPEYMKKLKEDVDE